MTQVTSYLFVTVMIRDMIVEIIPILGYEVTPKHTGHLKKKSSVIKPLNKTF